MIQFSPAVFNNICLFNLSVMLFMIGEPLTLEEAYTCLNKLLVSSDEETTEIYQPSSPSRRDVFFNFRLLSPVIIFFNLSENAIYANRQ